jgi:hypothetical protein
MDHNELGKFANIKHIVDNKTAYSLASDGHINWCHDERTQWALLLGDGSHKGGFMTP